MFFSKKLKKKLNISHCFFSNKNGVSKDIYKSLNCGLGSKDKHFNVKKNLSICKNPEVVECLWAKAGCVW